MTLIQIIQKEIQEGGLKESFKPRELKKLIASKYSGSFRINTLNSYLPNNARMRNGNMGAQVRNNNPLFIQNADRSYKINKERKSALTNSQGKLKREKKREALSLNDSTGCTIEEKKDIAQKFVEYIRNKPFRFLESGRGRGEKKWYPEQGAVCGWKNRLDAYKWNNADWASTVRQFKTWESDLNKIKEHFHSTGKIETKKATSIFHSIKIWGIDGTPDSEPETDTKINKDAINNLKLLWDTCKIKKVNSSLTKLYALACPDNYVIYDSRVAAAIVSIAEDIYRITTKNKKPVCETKTIFRKCFPDIGPFKSGARGGTRPRGVRDLAKWSCAYGKINAQFEANELCKLIRDRLVHLGEDHKKDWTLREVEAVLFMEGY